MGKEERVGEILSCVMRVLYVRKVPSRPTTMVRMMRVLRVRKWWSRRRHGMVNDL
jgi:hypothetical protein